MKSYTQLLCVAPLGKNVQDIKEMPAMQWILNGVLKDKTVEN